MSDFVPEGYLPIIEAFKQALEHWFGEEIASTEKRIKEESAQITATPGGDSVRDAHLARGLSEDVESKILEACRELPKETYRRLRNALHKGEITAVYFSTRSSGEEPTPIARGKWATSATDDVIETGLFLPFGHPHPQFGYPRFVPLSEQVLVRKEDLRRLLSGEVTTPPPLPPPAEPSTANKSRQLQREIDPSEAAPARQTNKGGKPRVHDWPKAAGYMCGYVYINGYPEQQAELVNVLLRWFSDVYGLALQLHLLKMGS
jgi:hypothetical protein